MNDDLISRQAAIEAIRAEGRDVDSRYLESERIILESDAVEAITMLPSVQPRKGKWLLFDGYRCSECNHKLQTTGLPSSCPNCGADMRGEEA